MKTPLLACIGLVAAMAVALTGCTNQPVNTPEPPDTTQSAPQGDSAAYPATITTKFGDITVTSEPQRIVALGWGDAETVLALGGQPIGASDWLGFGGDGVGPWVAGLYKESPTIIGTLEPSFEAIAALKPDLILDTRSSGDPERYARLSTIATTIGVPTSGDAYLTDSADQVRMIAAALGKSAEGEALIAQLETAFDAVRTAHPEWSGLTASAATRTSEEWGAYVKGSDRVTFLERLGFAQNPAIDALAPNEGALGFSVSISAEQLDLFDADLIVAFPIWIDTKQITQDPQWKTIPAVKAGHAVVIDGDLASAYSVATVPGTLYAIEKIVPLIEAALK